GPPAPHGKWQARPPDLVLLHRRLRRRCAGGSGSQTRGSNQASISAVGDSAVRFGGRTLLVLQDRLLDGGANEGGAPSRSGRSDLFEHFEGVFVDLDQ